MKKSEEKEIAETVDDDCQCEGIAKYFYKARWAF